MNASEAALEARSALARVASAVCAFALLLLALAFGTASGCKGSGVDAARVGATATARVANAGGEAALSGLCVSECRAIGHTCHRAGAECVRDSAPRPATSAELAELARVRERWRPVLVAHERVRVAHDTVAALLLANDAIAAGALPAAVARLAEAYAALVDTASAAGASLPSLPGARDAGALSSSRGASPSNDTGAEKDSAAEAGL